MKLPNGYGNVSKLPGTRRNPYRARKTIGWEVDYETGKSRQKYITIGYYPTKSAALQALAAYNEHPYDIQTQSVTFADVYEKWSETYFPTLSNNSSVRTITAAYKHCAPLHNMRMRDIRVNHLEQTIRNAEVGASTKARMKSLFNLMYRYALKHEIVDKDYAALCDSVKRPEPEIVRIPFSSDEIHALFDNLSVPFADMILIGIYTGFRPQELANLKIKDVNFSNQTITGGMKTDAGKNRLVPIHPAISKLIENDYNKAVKLQSEYLFNDENGQQGTYMTYDKYRGRFAKVMKKMGMSHKPHDTRHTFITMMKEADANDHVLKLLVGHAIDDITEKAYTHRTLENMRKEILKIK